MGRLAKYKSSIVGEYMLPTPLNVNHYKFLFSLKNIEAGKQ